MFDFELKLVDGISKRSLDLRNSKKVSQDFIFDRSTISKIENMKYKRGENFISLTVLDCYTKLFQISKEEFIFGTDKEIEELLERYFYDMVRLIARRNLEIDAYKYNKNLHYNEDIYIKVQKAAILLANNFAEYNLQRYNFLKSDELYMDFVSKKLDKIIIINGKAQNLGRNLSNRPINEETVIDLLDIIEKLWIICKEKFIRSFRSFMWDNLFSKFKYTSINQLSNRWIEEQFIPIIVPDVLEKLNSNNIFNIGRIVKELIDNSLIEDLPISYQKKIPLSVKRNRSFVIESDFDKTKYELWDENRLEERRRIVNDIIYSDEVQTFSKTKKEHLSNYGLFIHEIKEYNEIKEVDIDSIIDYAITNNVWGPTKNNDEMKIELGPVYKKTDYASFEEEYNFFLDWYDTTHFTNAEISGFFSVNSQIMNRWQVRLNEEIKSSIKKLIIVQNNLLQLITNEELRNFAK